MADPKGQLQVTVTSIRSEALASPEGMTLGVRVVVEGQNAVDSSPIPVEPETSEVYGVGFTCPFDLAVQTAAGIAQVVNGVLGLTLLQVTREKKKKADTLLPMGEARVPLLPLLYDGDKFSTTAVVEAVLQEGEAPVPVKVGVDVALRDSVLSSDQLASGNLLTLSAEGMYALPDPFTPATAGSHTMTLSATLPGENVLSLPGGIVTAPAAEQGALDTKDEVGALLSEDDLNFRQKAETTKPSLRWALPCARVFLMKEEVDALRTAIASARSLALSVVRVAKATGGGKGKSRAGKGDGDEGVPSFRGCASFPAASLMYPGVAEATAACLVSAPPAREADPAVKSKAKTAGDADKAEGAQYEAARTYAVISVCLRTPLVAKRTKAEMAARVASLVPPRPALPRVGESADKALADFHAKVAAIARDLLSRHRQMTGSDSGSSSQEVRQNLLYELNSSGRYAGFKEQLKRCVVSLVREKFRRTASLADVEDRQTFLNELYVYVVNEMHASLNAHFAFDYSYAPEPITMTAEQQQRLAAEAEAAGQLDSASELHKEALTNSPTDATVWYTAGLFYLRVGDTSQAEACLREAVALDQQHADALLFSAILAYEDRRPGEANTLLEGATAAAGDQPVVWCIRGLQHTRAGDDVSAELCAAHADTGKGLLLEAAEYLLRGGCLELAQSALSAELIQRGRSVAYDTARVRYLLAIGDDKACSEAEALVQENISADYANPDLWALLGHTQYSKQPEAAMQSYQHALDLEADAKDIGTVTLRLAQLRLADDDFEAARDLFLQCCAASPSATAWKGAGIALYRLDELQEAEEALAEANVYNSSDAAVWAYLSMMCLRDGRRVEAEQAFKHTTRLGLADKALQDELQMEQTEAGFGNPFV